MRRIITGRAAERIHACPGRHLYTRTASIPGNQRFVALKFLSPQLVRDEDARRRLFAEARAASSLDHANVCTIYDVEELPDGRVFLAMAFCDGQTLKEQLQRGPIPAAEAVRLAAQVAHALGRAHQAGIVHRDVKPGNIMVTSDGEAKLLDFGIAKASGGVDMTRTGTTLGTPAADKRHVIYPGGHEIANTKRSQIVQEMVGWLDKYLGRVQ